MVEETMIHKHVFAKDDQILQAMIFIITEEKKEKNQLEKIEENSYKINDTIEMIKAAKASIDANKTSTDEMIKANKTSTDEKIDATAAAAKADTKEMIDTTAAAAKADTKKLIDAIEVKQDQLIQEVGNLKVDFKKNFDTILELLRQKADTEEEKNNAWI